MSLIKIWKNRNAILEGIRNSIFTRQDVEDIAKEREAICDTCPEIDREGGKCLVPGTTPCCSKCGCKLSWKLRALSSACPLGKWQAILTQEEETQLNQKLDQTA